MLANPLAAVKNKLGTEARLQTYYVALMQTIDKGLSLLNWFSEQTPEMGLSELARRSGFNKATTRRFLMALQKHGLVEQDSVTRAYRLGPGILRIARVREAVSPIASVAQPVLEALADSIGETAHFSLYSGGMLGTTALVESSKSNRVTLENGEAIPLHATASGIAYLAFAEPSIVKSALSQTLRRYTDNTIVDPEEISSILKTVGRAGVAVVKNTYEKGVCGIASPVFAANCFSCGAVAIAVPESRAQRRVIAQIKPQIIRASIDITRAIGAEPNPVIAQAVRAAGRLATDHSQERRDHKGA